MLLQALLRDGFGVGNWQLLEKYKAVDVDEYQRVRSELEVAQKELQELKLKLTKFEEEKESKDKRLVELEAHVTELDKRLQEALQSEVSLLCCSYSKLGFQ